MKILVDASIVKPGLGGIATFATHLVRELAELDGVSLVVTTSVPEAFSGIGCRAVEIPPSTRSPAQRALWRELQLPHVVRRAGPDVVLVPFPELGLRRADVPSAVVIHDTIPLSAPSTVSAARWLRYRLGLSHVGRAADALLCISHATLVAVHSMIAVAPEKLRVINPAPGRIIPESAGAHPGSTWPLERYVLYVGSVLAHKNVETLVRAMAHVTPEDVGLLMAGPASAREVSLLEGVAREAGVADRVHHVGFVEPQDLGALYRSALAFAFPSLHEGFGLPVLEAMSVGVPTVVSEISVMREVADDAAVFVDAPLDPGGWGREISRVVGDDDLRAALAHRGRDRARHFSWRSTAERTHEALLAVVDARGR